MKHRWELLSVVILLFSRTDGQNLVPNHSFEDANLCEHNEKCSPSAWFYVTKNLSAGYFQYGTVASDGSRWLNIVTGSKLGIARQYWQTMLLHHLEKGKKYTISFSLHGWDTDPNLNDIGFYFSSHFHFLPIVDTMMVPDNYVSFLDAKVKEGKNHWFKITKEYTAQDDYQFLMIGNFSKRDYQQIARKRAFASVYMCVRIDDINISPVDKIDCASCQQLSDSLYSLKLRHSSAIAEEQIDIDTISNPYVAKIDTLILNGIYFSTGSYRINNPDEIERFRSRFERPNIRQIKIVGYTDDVGTVADNLTLSEQRAKEVSDIISSKFAIPKSLLDVSGKGITTDNLQKSKNRRVEIFIYLNQSQ